MLTYLRAPANARALGVDTARIVLAGHNMGGWVTAQIAARDPALADAVMISAWEAGAAGAASAGARAKLVAGMADSDTLAGISPDPMADE